MKYYDENDYTLYLGDVLEELKNIEDNSIDVIVTSPPYNMKSVSQNKGNVDIKYDEYKDNLPWEEYCKWQIDILNECYRVLKSNGVMFYNNKERFEKGNFFSPDAFIHNSKLKVRQCVIWDKGATHNYTAKGYGISHEYIWVLYKETPPQIKTNHSILKSVWRINRATNNSHPAPFPIEIPARCIYTILEDTKGVVLDPFNGSGTTGVASKLLGHKYIGIDMSENYLDMSIDRFNNYQCEFIDVEIEKQNHKVKKPYSTKNKNK
jgi:modification methylase